MAVIHASWEQVLEAIIPGESLDCEGKAASEARWPALGRGKGTRQNEAAKVSSGRITMSLQADATYENGLLKPDQTLPLQDGQRVRLTIEPAPGAAQRMRDLPVWKGSQQDLETLAEADDNHPWSSGT